MEEGEMASVMAAIKRMLADSSMDEFLAGREELRRQHGQSTFVIGRPSQSTDQCEGSGEAHAVREAVAL